MGEHRLAIRILGVAATTHGFAFAVTESPDRLIDWGSRKTPSIARLAGGLALLIARARPLFIACEFARNRSRSRRAREFNIVLEAVCAKHGIMILCVERASVKEYGKPAPTNHDLAQAAAARFQLIATKLPRRRRLWDGVDDRIGIFLAAASAVAGWNHFRRPGVERERVY